MRCTVRRQITVSLENRYGRLAPVASALAGRGINIEAISVTDTIDQCVVRMVPGDAARTRGVLVEGGFHVLEAEVLRVDMTDLPGRLATITTALAEATINVDYIYGTGAGPGAPGVFILKVSDTARARDIISSLEG